MKYKKWCCTVLLLIGCIVPLSIVAAEQINVSFEDTDIRVFIKFVSELSGQNFIIDETVQGKVSIICPNKIPVEELPSILESVLFVKGYATVPSGSVIKIVPIEAARQNDFKTFVEPQTLKDRNNRFNTHIVSLTNANAQKVLEIIKPLLTRGGYATVYQPGNTLIITDIQDNIKRLLKVITKLDQAPAETISRVNVFSLEFADAENIAEILNKMFDEQYKAEIRMGKKTEESRSYAIADTFTNTLIVNVPPQEINNIRKIVECIDVRKKQILVEVLIIETDLDKTAELGIEWAAVDGVMIGTSRGFGGDLVNQVDNIFDHVLTGGAASGYTAAFITDFKKVGPFEIPEIGMLITAFQNDTDINILSTPQIMTSDNEEAYILVGENRAFIKNTQVTAEGGTVRTFDYRDVGLSLRITPHVSKDEYVRLSVDQKVEDVLGESFEGAVETLKREARTNLTVKNGATIVIGGLIKDRKVKEVEKVPFFGDLPFLGLLFRKTFDSTAKKNLMIFLSPHIIDSDEALMQLTLMKKQSVMPVQKEKKKKHPRKRRRRERKK